MILQIDIKTKNGRLFGLPFLRQNPISVLTVMNVLFEFVRNRSKSLGLTQPELAEKVVTALNDLD